MSSLISTFGLISTLPIFVGNTYIPPLYSDINLTVGFVKSVVTASNLTNPSMFPALSSSVAQGFLSH